MLLTCSEVVMQHLKIFCALFICIMVRTERKLIQKYVHNSNIEPEFHMAMHSLCCKFGPS